jgi:UDP-galactopyranose mutase
MSIEPCKDFQGVGQMNLPDDDVPYTRIIEHKHFNWVDNNISIITTEYPRAWSRGSHLKRFYPIPLQDNYDLYNEYITMEHKAHFAGRLGTYTYMNMDRAILEAMILNTLLFS